MHDFLVSESGGSLPERNIVIFPNGMHELMLESALNGAFDDAAGEDDEASSDTESAGEVLLHLCALSESDLHAELSDSAIAGVEVVRLGNDEIRKDVIAYYEALAERMGIGFQVRYDADDELVSEAVLGYERVGRGKVV